VRLARIAGVLKALGRDVRGIAAVEFAFIAPILLLMLVGAVEITRAVSIDRRFSVVANMVADLVARQSQQLKANDVAAIYDIAELVMSPYDADTLKLSIIPVMAHPANATNVRVYPSAVNRPSFHGGPVPAMCQSYSLTDGMLAVGESIIVVEASYRFTPLFVGYLMGSRDWTAKALAKPRGLSCVPFDEPTCKTTCFPS
jgi:Flp pilus assembly pilin Flp